MGKLSLANFKKAKYYLQRNGLKKTWYAVRERLEERKQPPYIYTAPTGEQLAAQAQHARAFTVTFSILVPAYRTDEQYLRELVASLQDQTYPNWELVLADATDGDSVEKVIAAIPEERIKYVRLERNAGIAENTNQGLAHVTGDYVGLLDHDDLLTPDALYEMAAAIEENRKSGITLQMLYSDEDKCNGDATQYYDPNFKEKFNLDLLLSNNYICHFLVMKRELMQKLGFRSEFDGAQDFDLVLRAAAVLLGQEELCIVHIPKVLYHWRCHVGSTAENPRSKLYAYQAGKRAIADFVAGQNWKAEVRDTAHVGFYTLEYQDSIFKVRPDIGAVGGRVLSRKPFKKQPSPASGTIALSASDSNLSGTADPDGKYVLSGRIGTDGRPLYRGLPLSYSGYLHRAILPQNAEAVDIRNISLRPECYEIFRQVTGVPYKVLPGTSQFDITTLPEGTDFSLLSVKLGAALRQAGWRLLYFPTLEQPLEKNITVVIPNYNGLKFLGDCLSALLQQDSDTPPTHVIVVDNGSTDGSREYLAEHFPQVQVIGLEDNTGFCHAVNVGIEAAESPYVILLNNDTKVKSGFVKSLYRAIDSRPRAFSVSARMLMWDKPDLLDDAGDGYCALGWAYSRGKGKPAEDYNNPAKIFSACGGAAIYRKSIFAQIGLFDEAHFAYLEDLDIGYRAQIHGYENYYEPAAKVIHYGSASSGSRYNAWKTDLASQNSVYVIFKNMPALQILLNLPFLLAGFAIKFLFFCRKKMGMIYLKGLGKGLRKSLSKNGRAKHIPFKIKHFKHYLGIQLRLYANLILILKKS